MEMQNLAMHEAMEVHEILKLKTVCMTKSKMMSGLVKDKDLKTLLDKDVQQSVGAITNLENLLLKAPILK